MPDQTDSVNTLITILPHDLKDAALELAKTSGDSAFIEIVMDLGRPAEARLVGRALAIAERPVTHEDLNHVVSLIGEFSDDNRAGIERTLHRISAIRNRKSEIIGLTLRVGRAVHGTIDLVRDLIESGKNILFLGRPGIGKTTKLREVARVLADDFSRRVIVIDTSNEIAGDGDIPHPAIGSARRMQVPRVELQHHVMIEAVENHMPEVIIVDEIGTGAEAAAARTIAERGVQLIGTAHGTTLENLIMNPTVSDLVGGVHTVTLSDEEARKRKTSKTINERRAPPTFDMVVEMTNRDEVIVYKDTASAVDVILAGGIPRGERRTPEGVTDTHVVAKPQEEPRAAVPGPRIVKEQHPGGKQTRIFAYGLSRDLVSRVLRDLRLDARIVSRPEGADLILAVRSKSHDQLIHELSELESRGGPSVHFVKKGSSAQIKRLLQNIFFLIRGIDSDQIAEAVQEAEHAIQTALANGSEVALSPRGPALRKMQHQIISRYHLVSESTGSEPHRYLIVYPPQHHRKAG